MVTDKSISRDKKFSYWEKNVFNFALENLKI